MPKIDSPVGSLVHAMNSTLGRNGLATIYKRITKLFGLEPRHQKRVQWKRAQGLKPSRRIPPEFALQSLIDGMDGQTRTIRGMRVIALEYLATKKKNSSIKQASRMIVFESRRVSRGRSRATSPLKSGKWTKELQILSTLDDRQAAYFLQAEAIKISLAMEKVHNMIELLHLWIWRWRRTVQNLAGAEKKSSLRLLRREPPPMPPEPKLDLEWEIPLGESVRRTYVPSVRKHVEWDGGKHRKFRQEHGRPMETAKDLEPKIERLLEHKKPRETVVDFKPKVERLHYRDFALKGQLHKKLTARPKQW